MQQADQIVEQGDPDWHAVGSRAIIECHEPLIDVHEACHKLVVSPAYWNQGLDHALPTCYLRESVLARLMGAASILPEGRQLVVLDGWRPHELQTALHEHFSAEVSARYPDLDAVEHQQRVRQFVAPPSNDAKAPSPHLTGGSVDVTLCDANGDFLDMGTEFDQPSLLARTAALESLEPSEGQGPAQQHRRQLFAAMINAGFSNLASEWWHFDYGNQLWAWSTNHDNAFYGKTSLV